MPPPSISLRAPAKLNLFLEVLGKRPDGFHEIETVFQAISLHDTVTISRADEGIRIHRAGLAVPCEPEEDLVHRAARAYREAGAVAGGIDIRLIKRIPPGAGLGGGSSDAAAVLQGLEQLTARPLGRPLLRELAGRLGSDVPFFLEGGCAIGRGRGEILTPVDSPPRCFFLLAVPPIHVSTARVYGRLRLTPVPLPVESTPWELTRGKRTTGTFTIHNRLEATVLEIQPDLAAVKAALETAAGRAFFVTGSGSGLFTPVESEEEGGRLRESVTDIFEGLLQVVAPDGRRLSSPAGHESAADPPGA